MAFPRLRRAWTTSRALTVWRLACSVYETASEEGLQHTTDLLVQETADALDASAAGAAADRAAGDGLQVVLEDLLHALGAGALSITGLLSLGHCCRENYSVLEGYG